MTLRGRLVAGIAFGMILVGTLAASAAGWSAIAVDFRNDMSTTPYGVGRGASPAEAGTAALAFCAKASGTNCKVVVSYTNCGAFAAGKNSVGYGMANAKTAAESKALGGCFGGNCRIVVSDCND